MINLPSAISTYVEASNAQDAQRVAGIEAHAEFANPLACLADLAAAEGGNGLGQRSDIAAQ